jgi:hypothetical protein
LQGVAGTEAFVVLKSSVTNQFHALWDFGAYTWFTPKAYPNTDGSINDDFGSSSIYQLGVPPQPVNQLNIYEVSSQLDNWQAWLNGATLYHTPETAFNNVSINTTILGGGAYAVDDPNDPFINYYSVNFAGDISEVLIFNRGLDDSERVAVNRYLANKYAVTPVVALTSPADNAVLPGATNITLTANAADSAGIQQVGFYANNTPLGVLTKPPYNLVWSNVAPGGYTLSATAIDNNGLSFTSTVFNISVPGLAITTPTNNSVLTAPASVPVSASVVDGAGVSQVQFFQGTNVLAILTNFPYAFIWSNAPAGVYPLTAVATDEYGLALTSSVVNLTVDDVPTVSLTNPLNNARFIAGTNINLTATAADGSDAIALVQFFQGTNLLGGVASAPYRLTWTNAPAGAYALTARATDLNGLVATSAVVNVLVAGITLTNPPNNDALAAPAGATLGVAITDNVAITQVRFFQGTNSLGTVTSPPYTFNWTGVPVGVYTLSATAIDAGGLVFSSAPVTVIVDANPNTTNHSGDGTSDYVDFIEGRNPLVGAVPDTNGLVNLQIYTPLQ